MISEKTVRLKQMESGLYDLEILNQKNEILLHQKNIEFKTAIKILKRFSEEDKK